MKHETNTAFVKRLMDYSPAGALGQVFIIDAIAKYARQVAKTDPDELARQFGENSFVHPDAWQAAAKHIHAEMTKRLDIV